jgi:murein DD-endopeptidase MepM/ murein hydrolase activator NlpD
VDIAAQPGSEIRAFAPGVVVDESTGHKQGDKGFGNYVIVKDPYGNLHRYSHLQDTWVKVGTKVFTGDDLGSMGNTGSTYSASGGTGTHLDYRIADAYGKYLNPTEYLNSINQKS